MFQTWDSGSFILGVATTFFFEALILFFVLWLIQRNEKKIKLFRGE
jgi:hypothetical protein